MLETPRFRARSVNLEMEQGGWQPIGRLPMEPAHRDRDPLVYLLLPLLGYLLVCLAIAAVLVHELGAVHAW